MYNLQLVSLACVTNCPNNSLELTMVQNIPVIVYV